MSFQALSLNSIVVTPQQRPTFPDPVDRRAHNSEWCASENMFLVSPVLCPRIVPNGRGGVGHCLVPSAPNPLKATPSYAKPTLYSPDHPARFRS